MLGSPLLAAGLFFKNGITRLGERVPRYGIKKPGCAARRSLDRRQVKSMEQVPSRLSLNLGFGISHRPGRGGRRPGRGDGPPPDDLLGIPADPDRPGGHPADPLPAGARVSLGAEGAGTPGFLEPALFLPGEECGGVLGRAPERGPGVLAVAGAGSVAGPVLRVVDGVDVGAQLCGGAAALPAGDSVSGCRPPWRVRRWWPSVRRG